MPIAIVLPLVMAALAAFSGLIFLATWLRGASDPTSRSFAVVAFTVAAYDFACAMLYSAADPVEGAPWQYLQILCLPWMMLAALDFVLAYAGKRPTWPVRVVPTLLATTGVALLVAGPTSALDFASTQVKRIEIAGTLVVTYPEWSLRWPAILVPVWSFPIGVWGLQEATRLYRSGDHRRARALIVAVGVYFAGALNDALVAQGSYVFVYLIEYAFTALVLVMTARFVDEVVSAAAAREALALSEERLRAIFEGVNDAIFLHDPRTGAILDANPKVTELYGYTREEVCRLAIGDLSTDAPPHTQVEALEWIRRASRGETPVFEWQGQHREGRAFWVEVSMRRATIGGNQRVLALVRDISERKRAEEEHARLRGQLEHAMKMEAVGRLAGGVAHDFNNLLTAILGNAELCLAQTGPAEPMHGKLDDIARAARSAASLTRQLLSFSRKQILEPRTIDLNALVARSRQMLRRLIPENIELETALADDLHPVEMDEAQLEQIIVNLGVNARDAMPDGGTLRLATSNVELDEHAASTRPGVAPGRYVALTVSDTGHGMTEEVRRRVFEPFFTTKPKGQGTGLGLATAYAAVQQAGGFMDVDSAPGCGARLTLHLPKAKASSCREQRAVPAAPEPAARGQTILLVEDDDMVRVLAHEILLQAGYRVIQAANGNEACALFASDRASIDLLLTDVIMPGMNGRELANRITQEQPGIPVLFASGYDDNLIADHDVLPTGVNFISKPYTPASLREKVGGILAGRVRPA